MTAGATSLDLPLATTFPCRASDGARAVRHPVVIEADWTVHTGHDADLERIAAAFGGGVSCIGELRAVLPGFRVWRERALRRSGPVVRSTDRGMTWSSTDGTLSCCPASGFADPREAAAHCRGVPHVATASGCPRRGLRALIAGLGPAGVPEPPGGAGRDVELDQAWACSLDPSWVAETRGALVAAGLDAPGLDLLLALAHSGAPTAWLATTAAATTDPDIVLWAAWTGTQLDLDDPQARARWISTGTRRVDIVALSEAGYSPQAAQAVARDWGISVPGAAQLLARWVAAGYRPTPEQLAWVAEEGVGFPPGPPAPSAVERVARVLSHRRPGVTQLTQLAVAVARCGTVPDTVAALRSGDVRAPP
jgi:hypothetical protein